MKIAYINFVKDNSLGVEKRMYALAHAAMRAGFDNVDFYYLNRSWHDTNELIKHIRIREKMFPVNYYDFLFRRYNIIEKNVDLKRYDYAILRYPNGDPSGIEFISKYNVITEHHSMEIEEYLSHLKRRLPLIIRILKKIRLKLENDYGQTIRENVRGIIGVTDEIRKAELKRIRKNMPSTTIPNGIAVQNISQTGFKRFDGKSLDLVMIAASFSPWHGLDRIISSLNRYKGNVKINLHVVGNINKAHIRPMSSSFSQIIFHGLTYGAELDQIMKNMNLAVSTMALFRKNMKEACSLKTREYTARGIPFVLAYEDPDLAHVDEDRKFYLSIDNDKSPIEMDRIIDFARQMSKTKYEESISEYMRAYALEYMDWTTKIKKYLAFVQGISASPERR